MIQALPVSQHFTATRNACKLCTPLGACLAFSGVEGAIPFLHGSQGCSTYIRRYMISHFREPMDIASSNFGEHTAIFGGGKNIRLGLANVIEGYSPTMIGIATTCLSETIGDDVKMFLHEFRKDHEGEALPHLVHVATPSYTGTHASGYHDAVRAIVDVLAQPGPTIKGVVNLIPGMFSPADLRWLKQVVRDFGLEPILLPDYSDRLDGGTWSEYKKLPPGGTTIEQAARMGQAEATIEFGFTTQESSSAGTRLKDKFGVPCHRLGVPMGVALTDALFDKLQEISGRTTPECYLGRRGRLIDSFIDAHKYVTGKRVVVFGEEDLVVGMTAMMAEVGLIPVLCSSGGKSGKLTDAIRSVAPEIAAQCEIHEAVDFEEIADQARQLEPDLLVGNSKGFKLARELHRPLIRVGFPIHDRIGGARILHLGYAGAQARFDSIANSLLEMRQHDSDVDFTYF
ncbi:nitrogenase component 1 [Novipirellula artificiosorum]|uniref:Nitrogenase molybdenum-iron protein beta chain n=1 Tax=Novipirellula artificiosorum TaxID=2528016 RepID=A0A5C6DXU4_9BACT|nr:nitrogenase component 1 [Novipirellula artificiosorum]TWU42263.1 Nitrogenase molybdenum-iron protein beta chain [Novipirellula artificiosorum]